MVECEMLDACKEGPMGWLLDMIYGKDRPPADSAAKMDARMKALADGASRRAAEIEAAEKEKRSLRARANTRK